MPPPVRQLALFSTTGLTGTVVTPSVLVPEDFPAPYVTVILTAPMSPLNVFDISVVIEVQQADGSWRVHDRTVNHRDLVTGPLEAVSIASRAQIADVLGKRVRATLSCGQSTLPASIVLGVA
jgi:hypothetical protein